MVCPGEWNALCILDEDLIRQFSPGMTALSLFVPLAAVALAFWFVGSDLDFKMWRVAVAGIFVGLTSKPFTPSFGTADLEVALMHYSASFQLPNYDVHYTVGAASIRFMSSYSRL